MLGKLSITESFSFLSYYVTDREAEFSGKLRAIFTEFYDARFRFMMPQ